MRWEERKQLPLPSLTGQHQRTDRLPTAKVAALEEAWGASATSEAGAGPMHPGEGLQAGRRFLGHIYGPDLNVPCWPAEGTENEPELLVFNLPFLSVSGAFSFCQTCL